MRIDLLVFLTASRRRLLRLNGIRAVVLPGYSSPPLSRDRLRRHSWTAARFDTAVRRESRTAVSSPVAGGAQPPQDPRVAFAELS